MQSKRAKISTACTSVLTIAAATVLVEPVLLTNVIEFIPSSAEDKEDDDDSTMCTYEPVLVLQTIAALCHALPGLSTHVGPSNEALWRELVLTHFNFSVHPHTFNVEDYDSEYNQGRAKLGYVEEKSTEQHDEQYVARWRKWCKHP